MINLVPWRQRLMRRYCVTALLIISGCYILVGTPAMIYLPRMEQRLQTLKAQQQAGPPHHGVISNTTRAEIIAINKLAWKKRQYIMRLAQIFARCPGDILLEQLRCHLDTCELLVRGPSPQRINAVFANNQIEDLKQGGCPQCYRAKINVTLF